MASANPTSRIPHGYFEYEAVKRIARDSSWMESARGKAVKIIYRLLLHLPQGFEYRIVFMDRSLLEVFHSQREMLMAGENTAANQNETVVVRALAKEVEEVGKTWLAEQSAMRVLYVPFAGLVSEPAKWSVDVARFLEPGLDAAAMSAVPDASLYRQRR